MVASCWAIGRSSVEATNAFRIRLVRAIRSLRLYRLLRVRRLAALLWAVVECVAFLWTVRRLRLVFLLVLAAVGPAELAVASVAPCTGRAKDTRRKQHNAAVRHPAASRSLEKWGITTIMFSLYADSRLPVTAGITCVTGTTS